VQGGLMQSWNTGETKEHGRICEADGLIRNTNGWILSKDDQNGGGGERLPTAAQKIRDEGGVDGLIQGKAGAIMVSTRVGRSRVKIAISATPTGS
jgi:hypothetical protein